jgi:hypothetical protein
MYYIAYHNGTKRCDGYAPTAEQCVNSFDRTMTLESTFGDEQKFANIELGTVLYVRPKK